MGIFTAVLGVFALWDAVLVALGPVPVWLLVTSAPKLPLSMAWDFWMGVALLSRARALAQASAIR